MKTTSYERIISDYKLPIPQIEELYPYFFNLYEPMYKTNTLLNIVRNEMGSFHSEEEYFSYISSVKNNIIDTIKNTEAFSDFNDQNNPKFLKKNGLFSYHEETCNIAFTRRSDVYNAKNANNKYISIDLEKANFQICKKYNKELVLGAEIYGELVGKFTNSRYLANSKYLRQVIFGNLSSPRQMVMEKYYTGKILQFLLDNNAIREKDVKIFTHDEIVLGSNNYLSDIIKNKLYDMIYEEFGLKTHIESYSIELVSDYFVKKISNGKIRIKGIPLVFHSQVYKKYFNIPITKEDLAFIYEGKKAFFEKTIDGQVII